MVEPKDSRTTSARQRLLFARCEEQPRERKAAPRPGLGEAREVLRDAVERLRPLLKRTSGIGREAVLGALELVEEHARLLGEVEAERVLDGRACTRCGTWVRSNESECGGWVRGSSAAAPWRRCGWKRST